MGIFPITTTAGGQCVGFPDVCKTPAPPAPFVPVPYPNIAMLSDGSGAKKTKAEGKEVLRKGDTIRMSSGDEAGSAGGGMVSNKIKGQAELSMGWDKVKVEGKAVAHLTVPAKQNGGPPYNVPAGVTVTVM